jgi:hypothetical protein
MRPPVAFTQSTARLCLQKREHLKLVRQELISGMLLPSRRALTFSNPNHLWTGLYIVMGQHSPITGLVNIQGYNHQIKKPTGGYETILSVTSLPLKTSFG